MGEFTPKIPQNFPTPEDRLSNVELFKPFEWRATTLLSAGVIVKLRHQATDQVSVFECTDLRPSQVAEGLLTEFGAGKIRTLRQPAIINLVHVNPFLAQTHTRFLEFMFQDEEGRKVIVHPAFTDVESYLDEELRDEIVAQYQRNQDKISFTSEAAQTTLGRAADMLIELAESPEYKAQTDGYRLAADIIRREFLK